MNITSCFFSIIVPVYNVEKYIASCLNSILAQDFKNYEVIVVDDGSVDKSALIIDTFSQTDKRVRVFHKNNGGLTSARKYGCKKAIGEYIVNIDSDDFISSVFLYSIYQELCRNNFPDMLAMGFIRTNENGDSMGNPVLNHSESKLYTGKEIDTIKRNFLYSKNIKGPNFGCLLFSACTKVVRRQIYCSCQNRVNDDIKYGEDLVLTSFLLRDISSLYISTYFGYHYRSSETSMTLNISIDSLFRYNTTVMYLKTIYESEPNKVCVYAERVLSDCLIALANGSDCYKDFKSVLLQSYACEELWNCAKKARYKMRFKDFVRHIFLKRRALFLFYLATRRKL